MNHFTRFLPAFLLLCGSAGAQSFNIDIGIATPTPSGTFGAGAGQPGFWNGRDCTITAPVALTDISGAVTSVTLALTASTGGNYTFNNTTTSGDDEALMDDGQFPTATTGTNWTIAGLAGGTYAVYSYAWAPDNPAYITNVTVNGGPTISVGGGTTFTGYSTPITHAVHTVTVAPGGNIVINVVKAPSPPGPATNFATFNGIQVVLTGTTTTSFCDGSAVGSACVTCGNNGAPGNGCANSSFSAGAHLSASGTAGASVGTDTLVLTCTNMTGPGLFFQSNGIGGTTAFGDGELCASVGLLRLGVVFPGSPSPANTAAYPGGLTPNPIHVGGGPLAAGDIRHYQCWYRDALTFCTTATFNLSQGVTLTWGP